MNCIAQSTSTVDVGVLPGMAGGTVFQGGFPSRSGCLALHGAGSGPDRRHRRSRGKTDTLVAEVPALRNQACRMASRHRRRVGQVRKLWQEH